MYKIAGIAIFMPTYRGGWRGKKNVKIHTISSCVRSSAHHRPIHVLESKLAVIHYFNYYLLLCVSPLPYLCSSARDRCRKTRANKAS